MPSGTTPMPVGLVEGSVNTSIRRAVHPDTISMPEEQTDARITEGMRLANQFI
jgi:hypothetical protein